MLLFGLLGTLAARAEPVIVQVQGPHGQIVVEQAFDGDRDLSFVWRRHAWTLHVTRTSTQQVTAWLTRWNDGQSQDFNSMTSAVSSGGHCSGSWGPFDGLTIRDYDGYTLPLARQVERPPAVDRRIAHALASNPHQSYDMHDVVLTVGDTTLHQRTQDASVFTRPLPGHPDRQLQVGLVSVDGGSMRVMVAIRHKGHTQQRMERIAQVGQPVTLAGRRLTIQAEVDPPDAG